MWNLIKTTSPIWYFDATSSILSKTCHKNLIFLYSIVCRDPDSSQIISVADFFSSDQTSSTISRYLFSIADILKYKNIANFIVIDHSFTLINSVIRTFNQCSILDYLNLAYKLIVNKNPNISKSIVCKLQICAAHFLKIIIRKIGFCEDKTVRNTFIFSFTLLQNSSTIEEFDRYLLHIYNVFMQPKLNNTCRISLDVLKKEIRGRNLYRNVDLDFEYHNDNAAIQDQEEWLQNSKQVIQRNSPFTAYYENLLGIYNKTVKNSINYNIDNDRPNPFYNPQLLSVITKRLYHVPMWTGFLLKGKGRLTNNNVESYFKIVKHSMLNNKLKRCMPSEFASLLFNRNLSKYKEFYENRCEVLFKDDGNLDFSEERWVKNSQSDRTKGIYYSNSFPKSDSISLIDNEVEFLNSFTHGTSYFI
jgi:hypothetical protein